MDYLDFYRLQNKQIYMIRTKLYTVITREL